MYSEIGFIFSKVLNNGYDIKTWNNDKNTGNIYQRPIQLASSKPPQNASQSQTTPTTGGSSNQNTTDPNSPVKGPSVVTGVLYYKSDKVSGTQALKDYYANNVFQQNETGDESNEDPYISLITYFRKAQLKALRLRAADFAYLKDLGVYPINRLWILRRFPDNCVVPNNLSAWGANAVEPISTVVGWMKDKENDSMLSLTFNEVWIDQNDRIDQVITSILKDIMGDKAQGALASIVPVPSWSEGLLFGLLKGMQDQKGQSLTNDYSAMDVPTGDPNVLRTSKMRDFTGAQALQSRMQLSLETAYEQKYINGIDPGLAMMDILSNLFKMGTSDQKFILNSNSQLLADLIGKFNSRADMGSWIKFIGEFISQFLSGITNFIAEMSKDSAAVITGIVNAAGSSSTGSSAPATDTSKTPEPASAKSSTSNLFSSLGNSLLAGTIYKFRWPVKASIAWMSGISTTPWHLTIGNPYSPIINIGNVYVSSVNVKLSNDLGFNDMPVRLDVSIDTDFSRPLGRQELEKMFNNGYKRVYASNTSSANPPNSNVTASQTPASANAALNGQQPNSATNQINWPPNPNQTTAASQFGG